MLISPHISPTTSNTFYSRYATWAKCGADVDVGKTWDECGCGQNVDRILLCITISLYPSPDMWDRQNVGLMLMRGKHGMNVGVDKMLIEY